MIPSRALFLTRLNIPQSLKYCTMSVDPREDRLIWFDGEMTGLEMDKRLVEVACVITEGDLTVSTCCVRVMFQEVASYGPVVIHQDEQVLKDMNGWCKKTFKKNGLLELIKRSEKSEEDIDQELKTFLDAHTPFFKCPLAGNSVSQDRKFIDKYLPECSEHLHYRTVDVSTVKELVKRWFPKKYDEMPSKKMAHRSLDDIYESIEELKYYREHIFIKS